MGLLKIALIWGQAFAAHMGAGHDDALFARLADAIYNGQWLGTYDRLTLVKGPFYPMFIAAARWCRLPLPVAEQMLFIAAAMAGIGALRPLARNAGVLLAGAFVLLYGPYSWGEFPPRFSRDVISSPMAVLVVAGVCGMLLRRDRGAIAMLPWGLLCGLAMAGLWLAREEAIWLVGPVVALCLAAAGYEAWRGVASGKWRRSTVLAVVPIACAAIPVLAVCEANRRCYGVFQVVELKMPQFEAACGALARVGQAYHRQRVPCPAEARARIYEVSPAFRMLKPYLEGDLGRRWSGPGAPGEQRDMQGGWFLWAFREAAACAGVHGTSGPNLAWYQQLADEINAACDAGQLPGGSRHDSLVTPLVRQDMPAILQSLKYFAGHALVWTEQWTGPLSSEGTPQQLEMASSLVRTPLVPADQKARASGWIVVPRREFSLQMLVPAGNIRPFVLEWHDSPDVRRYMERRAIAGAANRARFTVEYSNREGMQLAVRSGDDELARIVLESGTHYEADGVYLHIDRVDHQTQGQMNPWRAAVVTTARFAVQIVAPVLTLSCFFWLAVALVRSRRVTPGPCAAVLVVILVAVALRTGLMAYIDATTYIARVTRYVAPGMLLLSYGWVVLLVGGHDWLRRVARDRGTSR